MVVIRATQPHFIRCIKPNEQKAAFVFEPVQVLQQVAAIDCPGALWPGVSPLMRVRVAWRARADSCAPAACWRRSRSALRATRRARALKSSGSGPFDGKRLAPRPLTLTHGHSHAPSNACDGAASGS